MTNRIFVADDHEVVREGVKSLLGAQSDWSICGEASDGVEALEKAPDARPDAIVLDISMPKLGGLDVARQLLASNPDMKILLFTMHDSKTLVQAAKSIGARGLVLKSRAARDLVRALEVILRGGTFFDSAVRDERKEKTETGDGVFRISLSDEYAFGSD